MKKVNLNLKLKKIITLAFVFFCSCYFLYRLPDNLNGYLIEHKWFCTIERNSFFNKVSGKKFIIKNNMIVAFRFKKANYTGFSNYKHLFEKLDLERDISNKEEIKYEYIDFKKNAVLSAIECHNNTPEPVAYIIVKDEQNELYAISHFDFRKLKIEIINR